MALKTLKRIGADWNLVFKILKLLGENNIYILPT